MCHPQRPPGGVPLVRLRNLALLLNHRRWLLLQQEAHVVDDTADENLHAAAVRRAEEAAAAARRSGSGCATRRCLCSPTQHPGSFRCRHHHADYVWGGARIVRKNRSSNG